MRSVAFAEVLTYLESYGYKLHHRRKFVDRENAFFVYFSQPDLPDIGIPVSDKRVATKHFERIRRLLENGTDAQNQEDD